ncbi:hypothetical protein MWG54_27360 (plasmid) [Bacillus cereus]|nr:hypothetical protein [Bacillus cereus]UOX98942.1 hypothetical protein MWG54_27360 [Bacillus cereus]
MKKANHVIQLKGQIVEERLYVLMQLSKFYFYFEIIKISLCIKGVKIYQ